jgi:hypothetical protein
MATIEISMQDASDAFWKRIVRRHQGACYPFAYSLHVERSIPLAAELGLKILCQHFQPKSVIEIGTGSGRSTRILANTAEQVATCDTEDHGGVVLPDNVTRFKHTLGVLARSLNLSRQ